jgi:hypothetical protein
MHTTIKSLAGTVLVLTLLSALSASPARAQGWGRVSRGGSARSMPASYGMSHAVGNRTAPRYAGGAGQSMRFGRSSAVSVAVGSGGVGVAVAGRNSAVAVAVGGGNVGVGVATDNGKAVSVAAGGGGVSVAK